MKKYLVLCFTIFSCMFYCLFPIISEASTKANNLLQVPEYNSSSYQQRLSASEKRIENYVSGKFLTRATTYEFLNVPIYEQEENNWCSAACVQMILRYVTGTLYSQESLDSDIGSQHYVGEVANRLNEDINNEPYLAKGTWNTNFRNNVIYAIDEDMPLVYQVDTEELPIYDGYSCIHYIVGTGYEIGYSGSQQIEIVYYNDPHYDSDYYGKHYCTFDEMEDAIDAYASYYVGIE